MLIPVQPRPLADPARRIWLLLRRLLALAGRLGHANLSGIAGAVCNCTIFKVHIAFVVGITRWHRNRERSGIAGDFWKSVIFFARR